MIPDHVVTLIVIVATAWFVIRFGAPLCVLLAIIHFWNGAFAYAACALAIAWVIEAVKTPFVLWVSIVEPYRGRIRHLRAGTRYAGTLESG